MRVSFIKLLFCMCCFITLSAYGMHNIGKIDVVTYFSGNVPQNLTLGSCTCIQSPTKKAPVAIFECRNVNGPEVGEKTNSLVMRSEGYGIATITIGQCCQTTPDGPCECNVNISCGHRSRCTIDPLGRTTKLNVFKVIIEK